MDVKSKKLFLLDVDSDVNRVVAWIALDDDEFWILIDEVIIN